MRIALLEDDQDQGNLFREWLRGAGHSCEHYRSGKAFVRSIRHDSFDLLILDWMVPDMDGYEVLGWVRENIDWPIPVLFVTAKDSEDDIVRALHQGADDYVVKPAKQRELLARINAVARRLGGGEDTGGVLAYDPYEIDLTSHKVTRDGLRLDVTQKEYELIVFLFRHVGRVLSRGHILEAVWGRSGDVNTRTVDTHVSRVRSKLDFPADSGWKLSSIYQHGYRLEKPASL